jgi:hypothetical protein
LYWGRPFALKAALLRKHPIPPDPDDAWDGAEDEIGIGMETHTFQEIKK